MSSRGKKRLAKMLENIILIHRAGDLMCIDELECPIWLKTVKTNLALYRSKLGCLNAGKCHIEFIYPSKYVGGKKSLSPVE